MASVINGETKIYEIWKRSHWDISNFGDPDLNIEIMLQFR
jgi:hypothetical protein